MTYDILALYNETMKFQIYFWYEFKFTCIQQEARVYPCFSIQYPVW